jgi:hypothetical protein
MTVRYALATLGLGLVGTALWVYVVDPLIQFIPAAVLRLAAATSTRWENAIHKDAAQPVSTEGFLLVLIVALVGTFVVFSRREIDPAGRALRKMLIAVAAFGCVVAFAFGALRNTSATIERCFKTRLAILAPHISDREAKEAVAAWTMMQGRADYEAINRSLREQAQKHNVLPVIKSLDGPERGSCL